jgi:hypothetical protein
VLLVLRQQCRRLKAVFADSAYGRLGLPEWVHATFGWILQTVLRPVKAKGFVVLPKLDRGTNVFLDRTTSPALQRLRAKHRHQ